MGQKSLSAFRIVILASGNGTNAERIMTYFKDSDLAEVVLVLTNNADAGVLERAKNAGVNALVLSKKIYNDGAALLEFLQAAQPDLIVLAGYIKLVPSAVVRHYPKAVVNIHPALLPKHGGKGMYGKRVHEAVLAAGDAKSGITIHFVNEVYDQGEVILQAEVEVDPQWSAEELAQEIHQLEYAHFPRVIEQLLTEKRNEALKGQLNT